LPSHPEVGANPAFLVTYRRQYIFAEWGAQLCRESAFFKASDLPLDRFETFTEIVVQWRPADLGIPAHAVPMRKRTSANRVSFLL
jgi:hypothetical protein